MFAWKFSRKKLPSAHDSELVAAGLDDREEQRPRDEELRRREHDARAGVHREAPSSTAARSSGKRRARPRMAGVRSAQSQ